MTIVVINEALEELETLDAERARETVEWLIFSRRAISRAVTREAGSDGSMAAC